MVGAAASIAAGVTHGRRALVRPWGDQRVAVLHYVEPEPRSSWPWSPGRACSSMN